MKDNKHLAHHFSSFSKQLEAEKIGVWLFLSTEILMFGGLFVGYFIYKGVHVEAFKIGAEFLDWKKRSYKHCGFTY